MRFTSSEAASLSVSVEKLVRGKRAVQVGTLTGTIGAGAGKLALNGRIGKHRLTPGRYRLTIVARDSAGNHSAPAHLAFTVLPR